MCNTCIDRKYCLDSHETSIMLRVYTFKVYPICLSGSSKTICGQNLIQILSEVFAWTIKNNPSFLQNECSATAPIVSSKFCLKQQRKVLFKNLKLWAKKIFMRSYIAYNLHHTKRSHANHLLEKIYGVAVFIMKLEFRLQRSNRCFFLI